MEKESYLSEVKAKLQHDGFELSNTQIGQLSVLVGTNVPVLNSRELALSQKDGIVKTTFVTQSTQPWMTTPLLFPPIPSFDSFNIQMIVFIFVATANTLSKPVIIEFSKMAFKHAIKYKNIWSDLINGKMTGLVSFDVLASDTVDSDALDWIENVHTRHYAASEIPIIYKTSANRLYFNRRIPIWGRLYYPFYREIIEKYLEP